MISKTVKQDLVILYWGSVKITCKNTENHGFTFIFFGDEVLQIPKGCEQWRKLDKTVSENEVT